MRFQATRWTNLHLSATGRQRAILGLLGPMRKYRAKPTTPASQPSRGTSPDAHVRTRPVAKLPRKLGCSAEDHRRTWKNWRISRPGLSKLNSSTPRAKRPVFYHSGCRVPSTVPPSETKPGGPRYQDKLPPSPQGGMFPEYTGPVHGAIALMVTDLSRLFPLPDLPLRTRRSLRVPGV